VDVCKGQHGDRRAVGQLQILAGSLVDLADEAQALAGQRLDQALTLASVADRLARRIDAGEEGGFRDDASLPDRRHEIVLADHAVAMAYQVNEQVEDLRLDGDQLRTAP